MQAWSIRTHLLLLVVAVSAPLGALVGYDIYRDMQQSVLHSKARLRTLAYTMVNNTDGKFASARKTLEHLASRDLVVQMDARRCDSILQEVINLNLGYTSAGYISLQGELLCSATPSLAAHQRNQHKQRIQHHTASWFPTLVQTQRFTVGTPEVDPVSGQWISVLSYPVRNRQQQMVGAVLLGLDIVAISPNISAPFLPEGSRYGYFSQDGTMIWRNADPEGVIGKRPNAQAARRIVEVRDGEFESLAVDGVVRYFSVTPMPETGWIAFVGVPVTAVYAEAKQRGLTSVAIMLAVIAALILVATRIARRIAHPVAELETAARALHDGNYDARAAVTGPREVAEVAQQFNTMVQTLQRSDAQLRIAAVAFESREGMVITNAQGVVLRCNRAFSEITGYPTEMVVGRDMDFLRATSHHDDAFYAAIWTQIRNAENWHGQVWSRLHNGEEHPFWLAISAVKGRDAQISHYVWALTDITEQQRIEEQVRHMAFYDTLTQLPNRRLLTDRLSQTMAASKRSGCYAAMMFLDLDNFKPLNDNHGHEVGDMLLIEVANRLKNAVREMDTVARFGGDEFVVMLGELDTDLARSATQAQVTAEKIRLLLSAPYVLTVQRAGQPAITVHHHCSASIGVTLFLNHETSQEDILKRADQAMYQAKESGRNVVCIHSHRT